MKRPKKKHLKRCNGKLELIEKTFVSGVYKCNKCSFKASSYKRRRRDNDQVQIQIL